MKNIWIAALLLLTNFAIAQNTTGSVQPGSFPKAPPQPKMPTLKKGVYVTDFTNTLTNDQLKSLNDRAAKIYEKSKVELVIVLIDALPKGMNINNATTDVDEQWNPGDSPDAERLIYIAGLKQHGHRIKGMRGAKTAMLFDRNRCTSILTAMRPDYDKHDYNAGLQLMVDSVSADLHVDSGHSPSDSTDIYIAAVVFAVILILVAFFRSKKKQVDIS